jgi:CO/xanthine dehydrogenase Mo-binding subunit
MVTEKEILSVVGRDLPKVESEEKASGEYKYASDVFLPNMLHCKILRSPHAHAIVKKVDTQKAEALPGVKAVITHKDAPQLSTHCPFFVPSATVTDTHILEKVVRHVGDRVAAVCATSPEIAEEALGLIKVEYEELPAVLDARKAMQPGAPTVHRSVMRGDHEVSIENNTLTHFQWSIGDVEEGFKQADLVVENEFEVGSVHNTPLERSSVICLPRRGRGLEIWTQTQSIHGVQKLLANALGIPARKIKVHRIFVGGAFGLHSLLGFIEPICAFLALKTGLPVRAEESREEMFLSGGRHRVVMRLKTGVKKDGIITARDAQVIDNIGAYLLGGAGRLGLVTGFWVSMYRAPNMNLEGYTVYTNTPPLGAMRGVGNPQQNFAVEQQMDIIAERLDMDPLELRRKNNLRVGDIFIGQGLDVKAEIQSCGTEQLMQNGAKLIGWEHRKAVTPYRDRPWIKRGIGMAYGHHTSGAGGPTPAAIIDYSGANVKVNPDGTATLTTASSDAGSGGLSANVAIVAEELGLHYEDVILTEADTDVTSWDPGTHASRGVYCVGLNVRAASANCKNIILDWAARILRVPAEQLEARDRRIYHKTDPSIGRSIQEVVQIAHHNSWGSAVGIASLRAPACPPHFTVAFVEVDVDIETGEVKLVRAVAGADVGTPINLHAVRGQIIGGLHMGMGYALTESTMFDPLDGHVLNPSFRDYKLLTPLDMPKVQTILADTYEPTGPFGAKGVGEGTTNHVAAAVANAIYNAIGVRIYSIPITPEKILRALGKMEQAQA